LTDPLPLAARLAGAVWGHLVGDAVGVPYEFRSAREIGAVEFGAKGRYGQPPGTWSDDGALMLALLDSLLTVGFDPEDQARRALDWYRRGTYTPDGDGYFDIGNATREALEAFEGGARAEHAGSTSEQSGGNGSLMRILPLALVERDCSDEELVEHTHRASRVTHGHERPQVASALYSLVVRRLLTGTGGRPAALADAQRTLRAIYLASPDRAAHLRALDHLEGWSERGGHGRAWDSFWSAWDAFAGAGSYRETIERAIRYGNDTDTTAAIAGGLAGIRWGGDGILSEWLGRMRGRDIVEPLVDRLVAASAAR
jgi:ADP-ribosylglycohydrolase